jgi:hypothetical protein
MDRKCRFNFSEERFKQYDETYLVENIKYTNIILGKNTKSTNLPIYL